jgi:hypothetical protein
MPSEWHLLDRLQTLGRVPESTEAKMQDLFGEPTEMGFIHSRLGNKGGIAEDKLTLTPIGQAIVQNYRTVYGSPS